MSAIFYRFETVENGNVGCRRLAKLRGVPPWLPLKRVTKLNVVIFIFFEKRTDVLRADVDAARTCDGPRGLRSFSHPEMSFGHTRFTIKNLWSTYFETI